MFLSTYLFVAIEFVFLSNDFNVNVFECTRANIFLIALFNISLSHGKCMKMSDHLMRIYNNICSSSQYHYLFVNTF
jgi:hypothetical protein